MELSPRMEHQTVKVYDRQAHYTARGPHDARFIYVGINGLMGGGDSFWPVIQGVPDDWRVVLPDLPGCGESEPMPAPYKHNIDGYARWLGEFLRVVGLDDRQVVLASVATGAPVSVRYAFDNKERVAGQVLHLPFLGKVAIAAKWARPVVAYGLRVGPLRKLVDGLRSSDWLMHKIILHEPPDAIPELAERDIDHKQQADLAAAGELLHDLMLTDARTELPFIDSPILILASEHDFAAPLPVVEGIAAGHPERRLYVYSGGQHSWNEEFIDEMNREIAQFCAGIAVESAVGTSSAASSTLG
ncbi:MAG: alpha/beta hydrolase [Chloroflexota bacterium]|nr:alpha/beta hydrolase [Chloroflexota bacterium]MDQ5867485.1 alpha/beta hydrolase [Chloroflexota bacterium]